MKKKGANCIEGCSTGARVQHYEFRVQTAKMKWVILGCNAGATWVQSGFKEGATREQSKCKVSEKPGAKWVQSGV